MTVDQAMLKVKAALDDIYADALTNAADISRHTVQRARNLKPSCNGRRKRSRQTVPPSWPTCAAGLNAKARRCNDHALHRHLSTHLCRCRRGMCGSLHVPRQIKN